jgi:putative hydrolase of the HAD superfamily
VIEPRGGATASDVKCVVFDIDDTLYLERDYVRSGFAAVGDWAGRHLGVADFTTVAWELFEHGQRSTIFDEVLLQARVEPTTELIQRLVGIYRGHRPDITLLPDALDCLESLRGKAWLAAVTDGALESQRQKADALALARWMQLVVFTAGLGPGFGKPHPRAFEMVEERAGCSGPACVYAADNPAKDFSGPAGRGWLTERVRRALGLHAAVVSGPEVAVEIGDLSSLAPLLGMATPAG